ncbi:hypothetical protein TSAR_002245 [Trichomalopsis sarcophagae]|uniref:Uncharacterized protein n=1 Tax=Trichomalopsis sarcophagae TaxID=543379 RepID=A0A232EY11_9HYME|nr:hypothetical protein TSAR_002245 [Trichomalopsis sarcophagae]
MRRIIASHYENKVDDLVRSKRKIKTIILPEISKKSMIPLINTNIALMTESEIFAYFVCFAHQLDNSGSRSIQPDASCEETHLRLTIRKRKISFELVNYIVDTRAASFFIIVLAMQGRSRCCAAKRLKASEHKGLVRMHAHGPRYTQRQSLFRRLGIRTKEFESSANGALRAALFRGRQPAAIAAIKTPDRRRFFCRTEKFPPLN